MANKQLLQAAGDGTAVPAGCVGEKFESIGSNGVNQTGAGSGPVIFNTSGAPSISLSAGVWLIHGYTGLSNITTSDDSWLRLYDNTAASPFGSGSIGTTNTTSYISVSASGYLTFTGANRIIYLYGNRNGSSTLKIGTTGVNTPCGYIIAIRIA